MLEYDPANVEFDESKAAALEERQMRKIYYSFPIACPRSTTQLTEDVFLASLASGLLVGCPWAGVDCCFPAGEKGQDDESMSKRLVSPSKGKGSYDDGGDI